MNIYITNFSFLNKELATYNIKEVDKIPQIDFNEEKILCTTVYEIDNEAILYCLKNYKEEFNIDDVVIVADNIDNLTWLYAGCSIISSIECKSIMESKRLEDDAALECSEESLKKADNKANVIVNSRKKTLDDPFHTSTLTDIDQSGEDEDVGIMGDIDEF